MRKELNKIEGLSSEEEINEEDFTETIDDLDLD